MSATEIRRGQVLADLAIVPPTTATQWAAWRLGFQPALARPCFALLRFSFYSPSGLSLAVVRLISAVAAIGMSGAAPANTGDARCGRIFDAPIWRDSGNCFFS